MELKDALDAFFKSDTQVLFIVGSSKSGKTTIVESFLKENNIDYLKPEINECKQNFEESINNFVYVNSDIFFNLLSLKDNVSSSPKVIARALFIDDIEAFISQNKSTKTFLFRVLEESKIKCIITSSPADEKRLYDLRKRKISLEVFKLQKVDLSSVNDYNSFKDCSIYEIVHNIFISQNRNLKDLTIGISSDPILISFMMYDNMIGLSLVEESRIQEIRRRFCDFSVIEDYVFMTSDWSLVDLYTTLQCAYIRHFQNKDKQIKSLSNIKFTQIPCRSSQRFLISKKQTAYLLDKDATWENLMYLGLDSVKCAKGGAKKLDLRQTDGQVIHAVVSNLEK